MTTFAATLPNGADVLRNSAKIVLTDAVAVGHTVASERVYLGEWIARGNTSDVSIDEAVSRLAALEGRDSAEVVYWSVMGWTGNAKTAESLLATWSAKADYVAVRLSVRAV
jgi:hypothetical protein